MVGIARGTRHDPAIAGVYTPPPLRARRYGAAWLRGAAVVEGVLAGAADLRLPPQLLCEDQLQAGLPRLALPSRSNLRT